MIIGTQKTSEEGKLLLSITPLSQDDWRILRRFMSRYLNKELNDFDTTYTVLVDEDDAQTLNDMCFDF